MTSLETLLDRIEESQKMEGQIQLSTDATSLEFLQAIYRDPNQPIQRRMRAAMAALPFEKPKLSTVTQFNGNDLADRMLRAIAATNRVIEARPVQVIEPPKTAPVDEVDHSGPFTRLRKF